MQSFITAVALCAVAASSTTDRPIRIPVQGVLADSAGNAIDGSTSVQFALYATADSSEAVWQETVTVEVDDGAFSVYLGTNEPFTDELFRDNAALYLAMRIIDDTELGRWPLQVSPYAAYANLAGDAVTLDGHGIDAFLTKGESLSTSMIPDGSLGLQKLGFDPLTKSELEDSTADMVRKSDTISWSKLVGIPAAFADGVDNLGGTANDIGCDGCVSLSELDFDPVTQPELTEQLTDIIRAAQLDGFLTDVVRQSTLIALLQDVVHESGLTDALTDVVRTVELESELADVVRTSQFLEDITSYTTIGEVVSRTAQLVSQSTLDEALVGVVHQADLELELANVVRRTDLTQPGVINEITNPVDWSRVVNVPAGIADGADNVATTQATSLSCSGCVQIAELSFDPTTSAELAAHKQSADHDGRYLAKSGGTISGNLQTSSTLNIGLHEVVCTPSQSTMDCWCPAGEQALSGGAWTNYDVILMESRPIWNGTQAGWRVTCTNENTSAAANCSAIHVNCARIF